jgi:hypothetical protein
MVLKIISEIQDPLEASQVTKKKCTESPPLSRTATASSLQSPHGVPSNKLEDLRVLRAELAKKNNEFGVYRIDKVSFESFFNSQTY